MSKQFKTFHFESPYAEARVDSPQMLSDLVAHLTKQFGSREQAVAYLSNAHSQNLSATITAFGYRDIYTSVPMLGEWLSDQGITLE